MSAALPPRRPHLPHAYQAWGPSSIRTLAIATRRMGCHGRCRQSQETWSSSTGTSQLWLLIDAYRKPWELRELLVAVVARLEEFAVFTGG